MTASPLPGAYLAEVEDELLLESDFDFDSDLPLDFVSDFLSEPESLDLDSLDEELLDESLLVSLDDSLDDFDEPDRLSFL